MFEVLRDKQKLTQYIDNSIKLFQNVERTKAKAAYSRQTTNDYKKQIQEYLKNKKEDK